MWCACKRNILTAINNKFIINSLSTNSGKANVLNSYFFRGVVTYLELFQEYCHSITLLYKKLHFVAIVESRVTVMLWLWVSDVPTVFFHYIILGVPVFFIRTLALPRESYFNTKTSYIQKFKIFIFYFLTSEK